MSGPVLAGAVIRDRLEAAWDRSDELFGTIEESAFRERPIRLRQPFLFYLGHLPAFAWNHLGLRVLGKTPFHPAFDDLFARGIDPLDTSTAPPAAETWPAVADVRAYRDRIRSLLRPVLDEPSLEPTALMVLEHELMHHETLLYMVLRLDHARKRPQGAAVAGGPVSSDRRVPKGVVRIPAGSARLGARPGSLAFGWDNEFPGRELDVDAFSIDVTPVRNRDYLTFVESGAYSDRRLWSEEAWRWRGREGRRLPSFWQADARGLTVRNAFADVPIEEAWEWPVYVTWAEASAYARQHGRRLATEAEYDRAAYGSPDGRPRDFPWGDTPPRAGHGNFGLRDWTPHPVDSHPGGASAFGVLDLVGNGWEWTSTPFAPFPGFVPQPGYEGYSADFFDGRHFVLKGASWATGDGLVRRSFRNWFQPHYPHVFAQFRLVSD
jgi:ergothioneine biosynthesis protein EgtB